MSTARYRLIVFAAALALAAAACRTPPADDLRAVVHDYGEAWLRGDSAAVLGLLAPDAVLLPHHGDPPVVGLDAIRRFWWPPSSPPTRVTTLEQTTDGVQVDGRTGVVWGRFTLGFSWDEGGVTKSLRNGGTYLMVLRREADGRWLITHRMWDDPVARPE